ncbi:B12-binding domain-containing radical SAM protein [Lachnotalea glycerini]|uniref:Radical SAM protein n=1 Tax=Lachnotalea glycerini TaxID=1763509 RepID=A0A371JJW6_9FIRM|nr:radical SAM protein [Lachnotalea glycerini]RDY33019.1 radical SAM protein [Lachnotalea glycerini]
MEKNKYVCLIQPHTSFKLAKIQPALFDQFDSIGLLALASYLKSKGYIVEVLHLAKALRNGYTVEQVINKIKERKPVLFGIGNMWVHQSVGMLETAKLIRNIYGDIPIVIGGQHASFFAQDIVRGYFDIIDGVIVGEGEETLHELVRSVENTGKLDRDIAGYMTYDEDMNQVSFKPREVKLKLDDLPFMSHSVVWPKIKPAKGDIIPFAAALDTVRGGCPQQCAYCLEADDIGRLGRRKRDFHSPEYLVEQLKIYLKEGKTNILIQDSFYANGNKPIEKYVELVKKNNLKMDAMHFFIEPGYVNSDIFEVLESFPAKKVAVDYGIETGSEKVAKNMNRYHNMDKIYSDVEILGKTKTLSTAWWLISLPGETKEDVRLTEEAIKETTKMGVFTERVSQLLLFPQTDLYKNRHLYNINAYFHNYDDFKIFSTVERRENGIYSELVTHDMPYQTKEDTLRWLKELKKSTREATVKSPYYKQMTELGFELNDFDFF